MRWLALLTVVAAPAFAQWPAIDTPLPKQTGGEKDSALIISIEDYLLLPDVAGATENAVAWYQHLTKTRGVPASSVVFLKNSEATLEGIQDGLAKAVGLVKPGGLLWILYIGHGAPSEDGADGVLVGADAQQSTRQLYARSLPRTALLKALEGGKQARSIVFLDACFSGQSAAGEQLAKGAMPTLPEKERPMTMKSVVLLTAGTSRQFAGPLPGEARPAFSYLALGGLRGWADEDGNGSVTAGELATFTNGVMRSTVNDRLQTPTLNPESAASVVLGKSTQKEALPLGDIVLWLKGGGARATLEPAPDVPRVSRGAEKVASLTVKTTPAGTRLDLVDPTGQQTGPGPGTTRLDARTGITWVWIPPGSFEQGCVAENSECDIDEKPATAKTVAGFWMAKTETTVKQFETCATQGRCGAGPRERASCNAKKGRLDHPLNCVDWNEAEAFCAWAGGRLPSATEWEYAAKSGQATIYPWGNSRPDSTRARFASYGTAPVGSFRAGDTKWGLSDMVGNVWEWTATDYDAKNKELRGGAWPAEENFLRASIRNGNQPTDRNDLYGFRCAQ